MVQRHTSRWARSMVQAFRTATTVAALILLVGLGATSLVSAPNLDGSNGQIGPVSGPLNDLMKTNRCSFTGFERGVIPANAIVRTPVGDTELVSFDRGWAVFSGELPGDLVAVCLGPKVSATAPVTAPVAR